VWQEYYRAIQGTLAVLPAFASPVYLTRKASSSVAAAVICGTPLLADAALLQAYSYLPPRAVFETTADERLAVAVSRIAAHSSEVRVAHGPDQPCLSRAAGYPSLVQQCGRCCSRSLGRWAVLQDVYFLI
jgi:hypothetical protein